MADFDIREYTDYDTFARDWHADTLDRQDVSLGTARDRELINEDETRLRWQLLGQLGPEELLIQIPKWLSEEKVGYVDGRTPTEFVGRIERETEKALLLADSAAARPLMRLAHRITNLEEGSDHADAESREWLDDRLEEHRREFENRDEMTGLRDEWVPKSQIARAVRRV